MELEDKRADVVMGIVAVCVIREGADIMLIM